MIPGDIDLTENLDFRKTVRKEIPQLPDIWQGNKLNKFFKTDSAITYINRHVNTTITRYVDEYIADSITWNNADGFTITNTHYNNSSTVAMWYDYTTSINTTHTRDNSRPYVTIRYDNTATSHCYIDYNDSLIHVNEVVDEYDVFGNKIPSIPVIPRIPWEGKHKYAPTYRDIAWRNGYDWNYDRDYDDEPSIPWKIYNRHRYWSTLPIPENEIGRAKKLISWFKDKSDRFIRRHLESEDETDLSYLTNMSWIRVKDAIID